MVLNRSRGWLQDHDTVEALPPDIRAELVVDVRVAVERLSGLPAAAPVRAATMTYRWVCILPVALTAVFGARVLAFRARGGYRAGRLAPGADDEKSEMTNAK